MSMSVTEIESITLLASLHACVVALVWHWQRKLVLTLIP